MNEQEENKSRVPLAKKRKLLEKPADFRPVSGQMVTFHKEIARGHRSPFGIGKILEIQADKPIHYQWYGNYFYNANGIFEAEFYNEREAGLLRKKGLAAGCSMDGRAHRRNLDSRLDNSDRG